VRIAAVDFVQDGGTADFEFVSLGAFDPLLTITTSGGDVDVQFAGAFVGHSGFTGFVAGDYRSFTGTPTAPLTPDSDGYTGWTEGFAGVIGTDGLAPHSKAFRNSTSANFPVVVWFSQDVLGVFIKCGVFNTASAGRIIVLDRDCVELANSPFVSENTDLLMEDFYLVDTGLVPRIAGLIMEGFSDDTAGFNIGSVAITSTSAP